MVAVPQSSPNINPAVSSLCTASGSVDILNHFQSTELSWVRKETYAPCDEWYQRSPRVEQNYIELKYVASVNREVTLSSCQASSISTVAQEISLQALGAGASGGFGACGTGRTTQIGWAKKPFTSGVDPTGYCTAEGTMHVQIHPGGYDTTAGFDTSASVPVTIWQVFDQIKQDCPDFRMDLLTI